MKKEKIVGEVPAVILTNPKYEHNVGATLRACSCFNIKQLYWTGERVNFDNRKDRIPREERMKGYKDVFWKRDDRPLDYFNKEVIPVAIEVRENSENLAEFEHPDNAIYIFGPEDGSIPKPWLYLCHRFVYLPTKHCLNLSAAVNLVLYDRCVKRKEFYHPVVEILNRETPELDKIGWDGR
jgi:tRNA(Leu) C34 or U34 (ribose-2'-O)-methylase TrmL